MKFHWNNKKIHFNILNFMRSMRRNYKAQLSLFMSFNVFKFTESGKRWIFVDSNSILCHWNNLISRLTSKKVNPNKYRMKENETKPRFDCKFDNNKIPYRIRSVGNFINFVHFVKMKCNNLLCQVFIINETFHLLKKKKTIKKRKENKNINKQTINFIFHSYERIANVYDIKFCKLLCFKSSFF